MFTIKYRTFALSPKQDNHGPYYDMCEQIHGPFGFVSQETDDGCRVVYAHRDDGAPVMTFGPVKVGVAGQPCPTLWVMNEQGATIAKYDL